MTQPPTTQNRPMQLLVVGLVLLAGAVATASLAYSRWRQAQAAELGVREIEVARRFIQGLVARPMSCLRLVNGMTEARVFPPDPKDGVQRRLNIPYVVAAQTRAREKDYLAYDLTRGSVGLPEARPLVRLTSVYLEGNEDSEPQRIEKDGLIFEEWPAKIVMEFESDWPSPTKTTRQIPLALLTDPVKKTVAGCLPSGPPPTCSINDDLCETGRAPPCSEPSDGGEHCPPLPDSSCRAFFYAIHSEKTNRQECNCAWRCEDPRRRQLLKQQRKVIESRQPHPRPGSNRPTT